MKILALLLSMMITAGISVLAQTTEKAPFGGRLIEKPIRFTIERSDGSKLTTFDNSATWYLTDKSTSDKPLSIPRFVRTSIPTQVTYVDANGREFSTLDGISWFKRPINLSNATNVSTENPDALSPTFSMNKFPSMPITETLHIEFTVKAESEVSFLITNIMGEILSSDIKKFVSGLSYYDFSFNNYANGVYYLQLTVNGVKLPVRMISKMN